MDDINNKINSSLSSNHPEAKQLVRQWNQFCPPNTSDDLCLLFCLSPSSLGGCKALSSANVSATSMVAWRHWQNNTVRWMQLGFVSPPPSKQPVTFWARNIHIIPIMQLNLKKIISFYFEHLKTYLHITLRAPQLLSRSPLRLWNLFVFLYYCQTTYILDHTKVNKFAILNGNSVEPHLEQISGHRTIFLAGDNDSATT